MKVLKVLSAGLALAAGLAVSAVEADMMFSVDAAGLWNHPQVQEWRKGFDEKQKAEGQKTVSELLEEENLPISVMETRIQGYMNSDNREGIIVVRTAKGQAAALFEELRKSQLDQDGELREEKLGDRPMLSGKGYDGQEVRLLLQSPEEIQIGLGKSFALPFTPGKNHKQLVLGKDDAQLVSFVVLPKENALGGEGMMPQLKQLKRFSFGVLNTKPEVTLQLVGDFNTPEAAAEMKGLVDLMLLGFQQNQSADAELFLKLEVKNADRQLTISRVLDQVVINAIQQAAGSIGMGMLPGGAAPATAPVPEKPQN